MFNTTTLMNTTRVRIRAPLGMTLSDPIPPPSLRAVPGTHTVLVTITCKLQAWGFAWRSVFHRGSVPDPLF
jgi:hypothetical protein